MVSDTLVDDSFEELNYINTGSFFLDDEFADETEKDEFSKLLMRINSDYILIRTKHERNCTFLYNIVINKTTLLHSNIDLPPPDLF